MKTINKDYVNTDKQEVIEELTMNTMMSLYQHKIQNDLLFHKTTLTAIDQLCANVVNKADKKTLELLGSDVMMTFAGLGVRVCDMLRSVGADIEHPSSTTLQQLDDLEGTLVVDNIQ